MPKQPPRHKHAAQRCEQKRKEDFDRTRKSSAKRGYGARWRKEREAFMMQYPLCKRCSSLGAITAGQVVDHIIPHKGNMKLFWDRSNWQTLCKSCHSHKTAKEDSKFANKS